MDVIPTKALIDCCVASAPSLSEDILSSSKMAFTPTPVFSLRVVMVPTPDTFRSSASSCPSTSKSPFISTVSVKVDKPVTLRVAVVVPPETNTPSAVVSNFLELSK